MANLFALKDAILEKKKNIRALQHLMSHEDIFEQTYEKNQEAIEKFISMILDSPDTYVRLKALQNIKNLVKAEEQPDMFGLAHLRALASQYCISNYSRLSKMELIAAIQHRRELDGCGTGTEGSTDQRNLKADFGNQNLPIELRTNSDANCI